MVRRTAISFETSERFLSSVLRNSLKSKRAYEHGLVHFQKFLALQYPHYNLETILTPLSKNEINLYEALDNFVSYLLSPHLNLTPE